MEDTFAFRKAKEQKGQVDYVEPIVENRDRGITPAQDGVDTPIALYQEIKGEPYTAKYYEVEKIWDNPDLDMKKDIKSIEKYYVSKVQRNEIADGKDNYKKFIKGLEKAVGLTDLTPNTVRISKLAKYIKFMEEADRIDRKSRR